MFGESVTEGGMLLQADKKPQDLLIIFSLSVSTFSSHSPLPCSSSINWQIDGAALWSALLFSLSPQRHTQQTLAHTPRCDCPQRHSLLHLSDANGRWPLAWRGDNKIIQWGFEAGPHTKEGRWAYLPSAGIQWKWGAKGQRRAARLRGAEWDWQPLSVSRCRAAVQHTNTSSALSPSYSQIYHLFTKSCVHRSSAIQEFTSLTFYRSFFVVGTTILLFSSRREIFESKDHLNHYFWTTSIYSRILVYRKTLQNLVWELKKTMTLWAAPAHYLLWVIGTEAASRLIYDSL